MKVLDFDIKKYENNKRNLGNNPKWVLSKTPVITDVKLKLNLINPANMAFLKKYNNTSELNLNVKTPNKKSIVADTPVFKSVKTNNPEVHLKTVIILNLFQKWIFSNENPIIITGIILKNIIL